MKIGLVAPVKPSHPYLENDPAPLLDLHYLRISPWLRFRSKNQHQLVAEAVRIWMNSQAHRSDILNANYKGQGIGFARAKRGGKVYFTQNFYG